MWLARKGLMASCFPRIQIIAMRREISGEKKCFSSKSLSKFNNLRAAAWRLFLWCPSKWVSMSQLQNWQLAQFSHSLAHTHGGPHTLCVYSIAVPTTTTVPESKTGEPSESALSAERDKIKTPLSPQRTRSGGRRLRALSIKQWNTAARVHLFHINISTPEAYLAADIESRWA